MHRLAYWKLGMVTAILAGCGADAPEATRQHALSAADSAAGYAAAAAAAQGATDTAGDASAATPAGVPAETTGGRGEPGAPVTAGGAAPVPSAPPRPAAAASEPDATAILTRAERAYEAVRSLEADFVQEVTVPLLDTTQRSRGKIFHRRPDRFLMRFSQPEGDVVVADGRYLWMYYPSTDPKQVLRTRAGEGGQQVDLHKEFLADAARRYQAVLTGTESVAGKPADVLVLTPRTPSSYRRVRIWVDRDDALVRKFEIVEENESVRRLELRNLKTNGTLADALFSFTPPPGAEIFEQ